MPNSHADRLLPQLYLLEQPVARAGLDEAEIVSRIAHGISDLKIPAGSLVALGLGSRGIDQVVLVARTIVSAIRAAGADVFAFPAMGSHGGATGQGQLKVLASLGLTPDAIGCEIRSSMDTRVVARITTASGVDLPVNLDAHAAEADGIIVVNRIKPHTHFRGPTESGLRKMLVIGAGKHEQALTMHAHGVAGLRDLVPVSAGALIGTGRVLAGVGIVEDGEHRLSHVEVVPADAIEAREPALLDRARAMMPSLPVDDVDLLVVDQIGKDVSGTGMDTNVVGRVRALDFVGFDHPRVRVVYARGLTTATAGNAIGVGLADLAHHRLVAAVDPVSTAINAMTGGSPQAAAVPITTASDAEALAHFNRYLRGARSSEEVRFVRIRDTLSLQRLIVSHPVLEALPTGGSCTPIGLEFDGAGDFALVAGYD